MSELVNNHTMIANTDTLQVAAIDDWEPIRTLNGIKWVPTTIRRHKCLGCPVYDECAADVARGDFAWCERVILADYELVNPTAPATPTTPGYEELVMQ